LTGRADDASHADGASSARRVQPAKGFVMINRFNPLRASHRLAAAVVLVALAGAFGMAAAEAMPMGGRGGPGGPIGMLMSERALDRINATPEQRTQLKAIVDGARKDLAAQRDGGRALRDQLAQALAQPTVDARAVEALRQQMLARHDQSSRRMMQAMVEASRVFTPEQRAQLAALTRQRGELMERHRRERQLLEAPKS
jgi:Spy/CpxP family protein refolding chaperone